jgi:two-component system phosphate regulon response regulator OmpR
MNDRVLLVDDDRRLAEMLAAYLGERGLSVDVRHTVASGLSAAAAGGYSALILDVMLPDGDGFEALRTLRATSDLPVVMLTARGDEMDRIVGLELLARIKAVLRRHAPKAPTDHSVLRFGRLEIDPGAREARLDGESRPLTSHQFAILLALARKPGRVLSREQILRSATGDELEAFDRSIDVHISRIRAAIEDDPRKPRRIGTVRGAGYVFHSRQDGEG